MFTLKFRYHSSCSRKPVLLYSTTKDPTLEAQYFKCYLLLPISIQSSFISTMPLRTLVTRTSLVNILKLKCLWHVYSSSIILYILQTLKSKRQAIKRQLRERKYWRSEEISTILSTAQFNYA